MDPQAELKNFQPNHEFLIAVDSDGCAFDSMEIKHKECFIPNIIKYFGLQPVSRYARAAAEFVNLYSKWRGLNRFPALIMVLDLLADWPEVQKRKAKIPRLPGLRKWIDEEARLGNPALKLKVKATGDKELKNVLDWSEAVNNTVQNIVSNVPPFPFVREALQKVSAWADIIVCSATPYDALYREWQEHDLTRYVRTICGQEQGSKKEHLAIVSNGKYDRDKIIMIGDAPGDRNAAHANNLRFYPVNPGSEEDSWEDFLNRVSDIFRHGNYNIQTENELNDIFESYLPGTPPWKK